MQEVEYSDKDDENGGRCKGARQTGACYIGVPQARFIISGLVAVRTRSFKSQNEATEGSCGRKIHGKVLEITQLILRAPGLWIVAIDEKPE